ncbi:MAG TPA: FAD-binding oxidoreductase [Terriglobales bacterium]|nr:FAD-binding oxidoreductase [Terriglobales bacterium]
MSDSNILTARLRQAVALSSGTRHLQFEVEDLPRFDFHAGQFVSIRAMHDGREITRAYSIASPPRNDRTFDLCLNRVPDGFFSNFLCDLEEGEAVRFHGPHGYFVLKNPLRTSIFVATGTGIAPIRGMIHWLFSDPARNQGREFWLVFGVRYQEYLYYDEEFRELERRHSNFHYIPTLSREDPAWSGATGYVQEHVRKLAEGRRDLDAYICGLRDMVNANRELLKTLGWDRKAIVYERFD